MTQSNRKLAGVIILLLTIAIWGVLAIMLYEALMIGMPGWVLIPFFALIGLAWMFPAAFVIRWMSKPDA